LQKKLNLQREEVEIARKGKVEESLHDLHLDEYMQGIELCRKPKIGSCNLQETEIAKNSRELNNQIKAVAFARNTDPGTCLMLSCFLAPTSNRAAVFSTDCRRSSW